MNQRAIMMDFRLFMGENNGEHQYSSIQINVPDNLAHRILRWGDEKISEKDISTGGAGREDELHITLLYGIHTTDADDVRPIFTKESPFDVELGQVSIFTTNDEFDVVKIEVQGKGLFDLNSKLKDSVSYTSTYSTYKPHLTIAYVKKGTCKSLLGCADFKGEQWTVHSIIFSPKHGKKVPIRLNTSKVLGCS